MPMSIAESVGSDALPRGIIKTVEVEVVEEDIADIERAAAAEGASASAAWEPGRPRA